MQGGENVAVQLNCYNGIRNVDLSTVNHLVFSQIGLSVTKRSQPWLLCCLSTSNADNRLRRKLNIGNPIEEY